MTTQGISWCEAIKVYKHPRVIGMFFLGFAAGLPLLLVFSTLSAWLSELQVSRSTIGFFGWVGITYSVKVFWAPFVDRIALPGLTSWLGQRRSWMLLAQCGIAIGLLLMAGIDPTQQLLALALVSVGVAFASATQDIALDAYRIEAAVTEHQGAMSASYIFGYRVALLVAGGGAFFIAASWNWALAYVVMAVLMSVGMITVLVIQEPVVGEPTIQGGVVQASSLTDSQASLCRNSYWQHCRQWFQAWVVAPFADFFRRNGRFAVVVLCLIGFYRLSDITMGIMANPFYLELGFSKIQIAHIVKIYGFGMTLFGAFVGGLLVIRYGIFRPLIAGATMVALTNLLFAHLSQIGADPQWLTVVISADNFSGGFSNSAFIAYLSGLTNRAYTATQYALFSSLMTLPGKFISGFSGVIVDASTYYHFFIYAALLGIPAIILALMVWKYHDSSKTI